MALLWPVRVLTPRDVLASPSGQAAISGGRTLSGASRTAQWSAGGLWRVVYQRVLLRTRDQLLMAAALDAALNAGGTEIVVPRRPGIMGLDGPTTSLVPFSDLTTFSDGSMFEGGGDDGRLEAGALLNATTITFRRSAARQALRGGEDFSVISSITGLPEMHRAWAILEVVPDDGDLVITAQISPPLRSDQLEEAPMNFYNPLLTARLMNPDSFAAMVQQGRYGSIDAQFEEV